MALCAPGLRFIIFFFFLMIRRPPRSTLFPYPPLSRSRGVGRSRRAIQEPPLVLPLRDGVRAVRVRSAGRRSPRVLAEQQQIPPHSPARRGPLLDAYGRAATRRLGLLVPQREQLSGPGRELRGP